MDIIVKSFNRPYYLDRCLKSIYQYVKGEFRIIVLDDGTPFKYLDKIRTMYPAVEIKLSKSYNAKVEAIDKHLQGSEIFSLRNIPTDLWSQQIRESSDLLLMLEDDIWLTEMIDLSVIETLMTEEKVDMLKIAGTENKLTLVGEKKQLVPGICQIIPRLPQPEWFYPYVLSNRFKMASILGKLKLLNPLYALPYYSLYTVAGAFFTKAYATYLWGNAEKKVNESMQLINAIRWKKEHPQHKYAFSQLNFAKTSFITSATNNFEGISLDLFHLNFHLNEAWIKGELDPMENFPFDFSIHKIHSLLNQASDQRALPQAWDQWVARFKQQYKNVGFDVD